MSYTTNLLREEIKAARAAGDHDDAAALAEELDDALEMEAMDAEEATD